MALDENRNAPVETAANPFTAADVTQILHERGWLASDPSTEQNAWCGHAAEMLGPHVSDRRALAELLSLIFHYDAAEVMSKVESHVVMSRYAARDVLRHLARLLLDDGSFTSERFKAVVTALKEDLDLRSRELFHPLRLALSGRAGEGELDRVILLVDDAAALSFSVPVKTVRQRILEFCSTLD
jgi:nondiscriminating glutamyl-tRNA synthetase